LGNILLGWKTDESSSESHPVAGFGISDVEEFDPDHKNVI
jgi:hypothetical protein